MREEDAYATMRDSLSLLKYYDLINWLTERIASLGAAFPIQTKKTQVRV
jgi:hypothetical protein